MDYLIEDRAAELVGQVVVHAIFFVCVVNGAFWCLYFLGRGLRGAWLAIRLAYQDWRTGRRWRVSHRQVYHGRQDSTDEIENE